jgi:hypothetical protein
MSTFSNLVGKRINGVFVGNDNWALVFRDVNGKFYRYDTSGDCCNNVWVNHITGVDVVGKGNEFDLLRGALVIKAESKGWNDNRDGNEDGYEVVQEAFWTIHTDRGYIDIEVRNSHNGYYGGSFEPADDDRGLDDIENLTLVTEDF